MSSSHFPRVRAFTLGLGLTLGLAVAATACDDPAKDKAHAQVAEPVANAAPLATPATPTPTPSSAKAYAFNADGSKVEFTGAKITGHHDGSFGAFTGTISVDGGAAEKSSVVAEIDTASVKIDSDKLAQHLRSADFFDVEKFPKAKFRSTAVKAGGEKGATHTVTGNLELHGVTKAITFPATIAILPDGVSVRAEFAINRKDFGIVYAGKADDLIKDDVVLRLDIKAKPKA
jgi:polyisoprenoid-binding protein YceI